MLAYYFQIHNGWQRLLVPCASEGQARLEVRDNFELSSTRSRLLSERFSSMAVVAFRLCNAN
jgi:hypothetical protein